MLDAGYVTHGDVSNETKISYVHANSTATVVWRPWIKPRDCAMLSMVVIGNGAVGGAVNLGGSSPITRLTIPAMLIPNTLYVSVPFGITTADADGTPAYVSTATSTNASDLIAISGAGASSAGSAAAMAATDALWSSIAVWSSTAGQSGSAAAAWGVAGIPVGAGGSAPGPRKITSTASNNPMRSLKPFVQVNTEGSGSGGGYGCGSASGRSGNGIVIFSWW